MKRYLIGIVIFLAGSLCGWWLGQRSDHSHGPTDKTTTAAPATSSYQCPMHPWVRSNKADDRCTICGMELTPATAGNTNEADHSGHRLSLNRNQIDTLQVPSTPAVKRPLTRSLAVAGTIDDDATRHRILSAYIDGRVDTLHVNVVGSDVTVGQPLADFYSPMLLQARQEYRQATGQLKTNAATRLRQMGLLTDQIERLDTEPGDPVTTPILSPMSGTIVSRQVYEGQYVEAGMSLFEIADFSTMWFLFDAYEQDLPWLTIGQAVEITTPSQPGNRYSGTITFIDPNLDEMTRSTKVRVEIPNPLVDGQRELRHRLYADGVVKTVSDTVLTVPRSAVLMTGPEAVVYVDRGEGSYERTTVTVGRRGDDHVEILSGLGDGDYVVVHGALLMDGQTEMERPQGLSATPDAAAPTPELAPLIAFADGLAKALAADDLAAFNAAAKLNGSVPAELTGGLVGEAATLADARQQFLAFTQSATAHVETEAPAARPVQYRLWECSMVNQAIPDAPKKARWIQTPDRKAANPFFGAEMLECASEVK